MYRDDYDGASAQEHSGEDVYSKPVRAGKRTYFFDVKATKGNNDFYLTITESKRKTDRDGRFVYDKHKIFLYKEDFDKFAEGLQDAVNYIKSNCLKDQFDADGKFIEPERPESEGGDDYGQQEPDQF
jgi:hypothetical protein